MNQREFLTKLLNGVSFFNDAGHLLRMQFNDVICFQEQGPETDWSVHDNWSEAPPLVSWDEMEERSLYRIDYLPHGYLYQKVPGESGRVKTYDEATREFLFYENKAIGWKIYHKVTLAGATWDNMKDGTFYCDATQDGVPPFLYMRGQARNTVGVFTKEGSFLFQQTVRDTDPFVEYLERENTND